jgi:hypothetical protein
VTAVAAVEGPALEGFVLATTAAAEPAETSSSSAAATAAVVTTVAKAKGVGGEEGGAFTSWVQARTNQNREQGNC